VGGLPACSSNEGAALRGGVPLLNQEAFVPHEGATLAALRLIADERFERLDSAGSIPDGRMLNSIFAHGKRCV